LSDLNGTSWAVLGATIGAGLLKLADKLLGRKFDEADAIRRENRADRLAVEKRLDDLVARHAIDIEEMQEEIRVLRKETIYWRDLYHAEKALRVRAEAQLEAIAPKTHAPVLALDEDAGR